MSDELLTRNTKMSRPTKEQQAYERGYKAGFDAAQKALPDPIPEDAPTNVHDYTRAWTIWIIRGA